MSRFTKYALIACGVLLALWWIGAQGVQFKHYALDPLQFFDHDARFLCIHIAHDIVILLAVIAATIGVFSDLRRIRKAGKIPRLAYVIFLIFLVWCSGSLVLWFTVGAGFMCGGG